MAGALAVVGERWSLLVVREGFFGTRRFEEFQANLGIARNILAARLRDLVASGVLEARRYQERPPRFEYHLTEKGLALYPVIVSLMAWGDRWVAGHRGPPVVLVDRETRRPLEPVLVDRATGTPLEARRSRATAGPGANAVMRRRLSGRQRPARDRGRSPPG